MSDYKTIAESRNFIVLDKYTKEWQVNEGYQSEGDLEREFIQDLVNQGFESPPGLNTPEALWANVRAQLQTLNNVQFSDAEWQRFVETWLDKPSDGIVEKTRKIHDDYVHDFVFDDGRIQNIRLLDKKNIARNKVQVIKQFEQTGTHANRYDVTILVNGLPLVQVELKKRGVKKVGVTGYCWGGTISWLAATRLKPDAVSGYYGGGIHGAKAEKPTVPTMLHFGDKDMHIPMTHVNELRKLHPDVQIFDYPADHGFHCDERGSWDAAASKQAMARTLEFFGKHVG